MGAAVDFRDPSRSESPTLRVKDLRTHFLTKAGVVKPVDGVSLTVDTGRVPGLVGESGSGKSVSSWRSLVPRRLRASNRTVGAG